MALGGFTGQDLGVHPGWQIEGTGDFNGSGAERDPVAKRVEWGCPAVELEWLGRLHGQDLGVHSGWQIEGIGDFDGQGPTDGVVWQNACKWGCPAVELEWLGGFSGQDLQHSGWTILEQG